MFREIIIDHNDITLKGHISHDYHPKSWVIFAHGSGSSRKSVRNNWVADQLYAQGHATLLFDLLTHEEDQIFQNRFDVPLLAERLVAATNWLIRSDFYHGEPIAYFGASTGAAAALIAASKMHSVPLYTVISRGGRPDLAPPDFLTHVSVPVLLIVGSEDTEVIELNRIAMEDLPNVDLKLVEGATHLFEEPGRLEEVVAIVQRWLDQHLPREEQKGAR